MGSSAPPIRSSSSGSPIGISRGSRSPPPLIRTKASVTARTARLLGSRIRPAASSSGSRPNRAMTPAASASANDRWIGMVKTVGRSAVPSGIFECRFRQLDRPRSSNVEPQSLVNGAEATPFGDRTIPQNVRRERPFRCAFEEPLRHELDPGEHEGCDTALFPAAQAPRAVHVKIAHAAMVLRSCQRNEKQQRVHFLIVPVRGEELQSVGGTVNPEIIAVNREKRVRIDEIGCANQSPTGFQKQVAL